MGFTALHTAALFGNEWPLSVLLANGANPLTRGDNGRFPIYVAIEKGFSECVRLLGNYSPISLNLPVSEAMPPLYPLHIAFMYDKPDVATLLMELGANVNVTVPETGHIGVGVGVCTPLMLAILRKHSIQALEMIARGCDVRSPNDDGRLPM